MIYRLMMLSLTSSTVMVKLWCSMMESPRNRWSAGILVKVREWWISEGGTTVITSLNLCLEGGHN